MLKAKSRWNLRVVDAAVSECTKKVLQLVRELESPIEQKELTPVKAFDRLVKLDSISNHICLAVDPLECLRRIHPSADSRKHFNDTFHFLQKLIAELNSNRTLASAAEVIANYDWRLVNETSIPPAAGFSDKYQSELDRVSKLIWTDFQKFGLHLKGKACWKLQELCNEEFLLSDEFESHAANYAVNASAVLDHTPTELLSHDLTNVKHTDLYGMLATCKDSGLRRTLYESFYGGVASECGPIIAALYNTRQGIAKLRGYSSYAEMELEDRVLRSTEEVSTFLDSVHSGLEETTAVELERLAASSNLKRNEIGWWDIPFLSKNLRKQEVHQRTESPKHYFSVANTLDAVRSVTSSLFGVELHVSESLSKGAWADSVYCLECVDTAKGESLGYIYVDLFARDGKTSADATYSLQCGHQSNNIAHTSMGIFADLAKRDHRQLPVVAVICNIRGSTMPSTNDSSSFHRIGPLRNTRLSPTEASTVFHEMGHALHSVLARTFLQHSSGVRTAIDYCEMPSQLMERFLRSWNMVGSSFTDDKGKVIPQDLFEQCLSNSELTPGLTCSTQLIYSAIDLAFAMNTVPGTFITPQELESQCKRAMEKYSPMPISDRVLWHGRFTHLTTYGCGYYSYLLSNAMASQIWHTVFQNGSALTLDNGLKYRTLALQPGGAVPAAECFSALCGDLDPCWMIEDMKPKTA